jgi:hypothetical protein
LRLGKERRNGVRFVGRDLRHDAQNRLALRHRVSPPLPEKIFVNALNSPALPLPTFVPALATWQVRLPIFVWSGLSGLVSLVSLVCRVCQPCLTVCL